MVYVYKLFEGLLHFIFNAAIVLTRNNVYFSLSKACNSFFNLISFNIWLKINQFYLITFRKYLKTEIERHRPQLGSCLGAFSSTFPVAYLEPHLNKHNQFSLVNRIADHSLEAQGELFLHCTIVADN